MCLKVPFRLAAQTFQLGRRMSSSQKGCGTSVTSSKPVAIGSTSGLESTEAAASIDGGWATRLTRGRVRCGEVWPRITLVEEKLLVGMKAAACASNSSTVHVAGTFAQTPRDRGGNRVTVSIDYLLAPSLQSELASRPSRPQLPGGTEPPWWQCKGAPGITGMTTCASAPSSAPLGGEGKKKSSAPLSPPGRAGVGGASPSLS